MRKIVLGLLLVSLAGTAVYLYRRKKEPIEIGYAASRNLTIWSTYAAVRQPVATVDFGTRLEVLRHFKNHVRVRTASGTTGWVNESNVLAPDFWEKTKHLEAQTAAMPVEAVGHTAVLTNLHVAPGRSAPLIRQLETGVPVEMYERRPLDVPGAAAQAQRQNGSAATPTDVRKEDWWLVRAHLRDQTSLSGWVLGRFIQRDLPEVLYDYSSSANVNPIAWFRLDSIPDGRGGTRPQYLLVGTRGPEGQPCDFTLLRVYTWSRNLQQYETAYVNSGVCGMLPIHVKRLSASVATFSFEDRSHGAPMQEVFRLQQTMVRRERLTGDNTSSRKRIHG